MLSLRSVKGQSGGTAKGYRGQYEYLKELQTIFHNFNVTMENNLYNRRKVDIVIRDAKTTLPLRVFEVTNYSPTVWMSRPRANRYIRNLNAWKKENPNIYRAIVISYPYAVDKIQGKRTSKGNSKGVREMFDDEEIEVIVFKEIP